MPGTDLGALLGGRLRERREAIGWSQAQLAEAVGVSPNYIGVIERGEKLPTLEVVESASRALGVTVGALFAEDAPDAWADQAVALARAVPAAHRSLVIAVLQAIVTETRQGARLARRYERPPPDRTGSVAEKRGKKRRKA
ncbi:MAG TPA: helix-turn-helix transcriptional regulator [Polyangiaceae bacterium]|nr:helix-turn-helix transcriptional regulator [Polyangiaceae bacterium]